MTALLALALLAAAPAGDARPTLSVLYFDNNTGASELDVLGKGLAELMATDLVAWDGVVVVERARLEAVLGELKLQKGAAFDKASTAKLGQLLGARYLVLGAIQRDGDELQVTARLVEAATGEAAVATSARGAADGVFDLEQRLVERLTAAIGLKLGDPMKRRRAKVPDLDALLAYSRALDLSDTGDVEGAERALQALVSKAPTFGLARERRADLAERLKEARARRRDAVTDAVLEVGRLADEALEDGRDFSKLKPDAQARRLMFRGLRAQVLARLLKQKLSSRLESPRVVRPGAEAQALGLMRAWVDNQRVLREEASRWKPAVGPRIDVAVPPELREPVRAAGFKESVAVEDAVITLSLAEFILGGSLEDGAHFTVAPPLGAMDEAEGARARAELDAAIDAVQRRLGGGDPIANRRTEAVLVRLTTSLARLLEAQEDDDGAAVVWQRLIDALPTSDGATAAEKAIEAIIAGRSELRRQGGVLQRALATCAEFHVQQVQSARLRQRGLAGLEGLARQLEERCLGQPGLTTSWGRFYRSLASVAARADACALAKRWHLMAYTWGGTDRRALETQAAREPWCQYGFDDALPPVVMVLAPSLREGRHDAIRRALQVLLGEELGARGVIVDDSSRGGRSALISLGLEARGAEVAASLRFSGAAVEPRTVAVESRAGELDVGSLADAVLVGLKPGAPIAPCERVGAAKLSLLEAFGRGLLLFDRRRFTEAREVLEGVAGQAGAPRVVGLWLDAAKHGETGRRSR